MAEVDTIKVENLYLNVGDPVPVNPFDDHDMHVKHHQEFLDQISKDEESGFKKQKMLIIAEHIELHKQCKKRRPNR
jgi:hypothetical protein